MVKFLLSCFFLLAGITSAIQAAIIYDESVDGDLSNSGTSATVVGSLSLGSNEVLGMMVNDTDVDREYFTFTVPTGLQLNAIMLLPGTSVSGSFAFIAMQAGTQVTLPPFPASAAGLLGWHHYNSGDIGNNILEPMSVPSFGSSGFSIPLPGGEYAIWLQELDGGTFTYGLDFVVTSAVPEPSTAASLVAGLAAVLVFSRRLRHRV